MGLDELLKKLKDDFQKSKEDILTNAKIVEKKLLDEAKKEINLYKKREREFLEKKYEEEKKRSLMALNSQLKLERNKFKGELLNTFFESFKKEILSLNMSDYENIYRAFILKEDFENEMEVFIGSKEKKLNEVFVKNISKEMKKNLIFKGRSNDFEHGLIFVGKTYETNLSFAEISKKIKEEHLLKITKEILNERG
ncbi:hypothetical protein J7L48_08480 [bacterium]|nr:hypothetical protein [bacterium]